MYTYKNPDATHYIAYEDLFNDSSISKAIFKMASCTTKNDLTSEEKALVRQWLGLKYANVLDVYTTEDEEYTILVFTLSDGTVKQVKIKKGASVASTQTEQSYADAGENIITFFDKDGNELGKTSVFNGHTGSPGIQGKQGEQGIQGKKGEDGKDGTKITKISYQNEAGEYSKDRQYTLVTVAMSEGGPYTFRIPDGLSGKDGVGIKSIAAASATNTDGSTNVTITFTDDSTEVIKMPAIGSNIKNVAIGSITEDYKTPIIITYFNGTQKTFYIPRGEQGEQGPKGDSITLVTSTHVEPTSKSAGYSILKFFAGQDTTNPVGSVTVYDGSSIIDVKETKLANGNTQVQFQTTAGTYLPNSIEISKGDKGDKGSAIDGVSYTYDTTGDTIATFTVDDEAIASPIHIQRGIQGVSVTGVEKLADDANGNGRFVFTLSDGHNTDTLTIPKGKTGDKGDTGYSVGSVTSTYTDPIVKDKEVVAVGYTTMTFKLNDKSETALSEIIKVYDGQQGLTGQRGNGLNKVIVDDSTLYDKDGNLLPDGYSTCTLYFDDSIEFDDQSTTEASFKIHRGIQGTTGTSIQKVQTDHTEASTEIPIGYTTVTITFDNAIIYEGVETTSISFDVPDGKQGIQGVQGNNGVSVESITQSSDLTTMYVNLDNGKSSSITLPIGPAGEPGDDGISSTIVANQTFDTAGNLSALTFTITTDGVETTTSDLMAGVNASKLSLDGSTPMVGQLVGAGSVEESIYIKNEVGSGFSVENAADDGVGSRITNSGNGIGEYIVNGGSGTGLEIDNDSNSTGTALCINSNGSPSNLLRLAYSAKVYVDFTVNDDGSLTLTSSNGKTTKLLSE